MSAVWPPPRAVAPAAPGGRHRVRERRHPRLVALLTGLAAAVAFTVLPRTAPPSPAPAAAAAQATTSAPVAVHGFAALGVVVQR